MRANCVVCGKGFEKAGGAKTCGRDCSRANQRLADRRFREKRGLAGQQIACAVCGKQFTRTGTHKTCSADCSGDLRRQRYRKYNAMRPKGGMGITGAGREKRRESQRRQRMLDPQKFSARNRAYREANPGKVRESKRKYYFANIGSCRKKAVDRARVLAASSKLGIPPLVYAAMKLRERFTQESTNA